MYNIIFALHVLELNTTYLFFISFYKDKGFCVLCSFVAWEMDLPPDPGARHLAEQRARGSRLLFGASALRPWLF